MKKLLLILLFLFLLVSGASASDNLLEVFQIDEKIEVDGNPQYYPLDPYKLGEMSIRMVHDGQLLYVHVTAPITGWVAVGFNAQNRGMDGANMFIGLIEDGLGIVRDDIGRGFNHRAVAENAIVESIFKVEDGLTVMEFSYPLQFPDDNNYRIDSLELDNTYSFIVAYHNNQYNLSRRHSYRARVEIKITDNR